MASSSSDTSNSSIESETSQEMTPEFDSKVAYGACAPLHPDVEECDFWAWSEDDESLTDDEDLQKMMTMTCPGKGTTPPQKRRMMMSRPRRTRRQGVSCTPGHLTKTTMEMTAGTPTMEPTATLAPLVMMVSEMTAATAAAAMMMATLAQFLQSSIIDFQAPTGGSVSIHASSR
jgi:hypothetical protein